MTGAIVPKPAYLYLKGGNIFKGFSCRSEGTGEGEICYDATPTGIQEAARDTNDSKNLYNQFKEMIRVAKIQAFIRH